jgi:hypothetical protein
MLSGLFWLTALARLAMGVYMLSDPLAALRIGGWSVPGECHNIARTVTVLAGALLVQFAVLTSMMAVLAGALGSLSRGTTTIVCTEMLCDAVAMAVAIYSGGSEQIVNIAVSAGTLCVFGGMLAYRLWRKQKLIATNAQYSKALLADHLAEDV